MKKLFKKRNKARKILLQSLYSLTLNEDSMAIKSLLNLHNNNKLDTNYLNYLLYNIPKKTKILNQFFEYNTQKNTSISLLEKIIIKIALFELLFYKDIPIKVIINESLELSKKFCSRNSHFLINKILNNITKGFIYNNNLLL